MATKQPDKPKNSERRRGQRKSFGFYMRVLNDQTDETLGHLVEVSAEGFRLETSAVLPAQTQYQLRMELTPDISDSLFMFITARTKWCKPDTIMPNLYHVGFQIVSMEPHDHEIYQRLLAKYGGS
ncbi:MAG: PilZ domain-containing protein [Chloroflexota bacterium]